MPKPKVILDTSDELFIQIKTNHAKLIRPESIKNIDTCKNTFKVSHLLSLPLNIGYLDTTSIIQNINENTIKIAGYLSVNDTIGKTVRIAAKKEAADFSINHDYLVLQQKKLIILEENYSRLTDDLNFQAISIKTPLYDEKDKILGVFFCSIPIAAPLAYPLANAITLVRDLGLLNQATCSTDISFPNAGVNIDNIYISKRETECLHYLSRGNTIKMIGKILDLSPRTVGHYLENAKTKLNVSNKTELLEKWLDNEKQHG